MSKHNKPILDTVGGGERKEREVAEGRHIKRFLLEHLAYSTTGEGKLKSYTKGVRRVSKSGDSREVMASRQTSQK